jgi:hypothetical protein
VTTRNQMSMHITDAWFWSQACMRIE